MDDKLLIALVAAGAAILGSVIPTIFNFWNNAQQRKFEVKKALLEKQKEAYFHLLNTLQSIINEQNSEKLFLTLQEAGNQVAIYGDKEAAQTYLDYYYELISQSQGHRKPLGSVEHKDHQTKIMNAMRLGLGLPKIKNFEIIGFHSPTLNNKTLQSTLNDGAAEL